MVAISTKLSARWQKRRQSVGFLCDLLSAWGRFLTWSCFLGPAANVTDNLMVQRNQLEHTQANVSLLEGICVFLCCSFVVQHLQCRSTKRAKTRKKQKGISNVWLSRLSRANSAWFSSCSVWSWRSCSSRTTSGTHATRRTTSGFFQTTALLDDSEFAFVLAIARNSQLRVQAPTSTCKRATSPLLPRNHLQETLFATKHRNTTRNDKKDTSHWSFVCVCVCVIIG